MNNQFKRWTANPSLLKLIDDYIINGHMNFSDLEDIDKDMIVARLIEILDTESACAFILHSNNLDTALVEFRQFLKTAKPSYARGFAEVLRIDSHEYFAEDLDRIFEVRVGLHRYNIMVERGFTLNQCMQSGEWGYI